MFDEYNFVNGVYVILLVFEIGRVMFVIDGCVYEFISNIIGQWGGVIVQECGNVYIFFVRISQGDFVGLFEEMGEVLDVGIYVFVKMCYSMFEDEVQRCIIVWQVKGVIVIIVVGDFVEVL